MDGLGNFLARKRDANGPLFRNCNRWRGLERRPRAPYRAAPSSPDRAALSFLPPSGEISPLRRPLSIPGEFMRRISLSEQIPSIWGAPLHLVVWDGAIRGSNGRTFKSSSSPLPLSAELRHSASNEAPSTPSAEVRSSTFSDFVHPVHVPHK
jgi:hypothetical protein